MASSSPPPFPRAAGRVARRERTATSLIRPWLLLRLYSLYRLLLAGVLLILMVFDWAPQILGQLHPDVFMATAAGYLLAGMVGMLLNVLRWPAFDAQVYSQVYVDIVAIVLLTHASGGVASGLGLLLVIVIAISGMLMAGRLALFFAAFASLALLVEEVYGHLGGLFPQSSYTHTGILGTALLATAVLAHYLAWRLNASEALASQRGADLASLERLNAHIIRQLQTGVIVVDMEGRVRLLNRAATTLLRHPADQPPDTLDSLAPELSASLAAWRTAREQAESLIHLPGRERTLEVRMMPLDEAGAGRVVVFIEDASAVSQRVQQLKLASLGRLTANLAHEIRNPLGAISHAAQLLAESPQLVAGDQRLLGIIGQQSQRVNEIVKDILALSGRSASPSPKVIALHGWLEEFVDQFRVAERVAPGAIEVDVQPLEMMIEFDPTHLHQILTNLCFNALHHGRAPGADPYVGVTAGFVPASHEPYLDIRDVGPGIDPTVEPHLFEPFFTTRSSGSGLGLYIARELCRLNRAELSFRRQDGGGSCFRILFSGHTLTGQARADRGVEPASADRPESPENGTARLGGPRAPSDPPGH